VATAAVLTASFFASPIARAQLPQFIPQAAVENAALLLPDAPVAQNQAALPPATNGPTAPATPGASSSSSPQTTPAAPTGDAADAKKMQHDQAERDLKVEEKQRLLGVMPQFQVVMNGQRCL
jgi:hypothetical protein